MLDYCLLFRNGNVYKLARELIHRQFDTTLRKLECDILVIDICRIFYRRYKYLKNRIEANIEKIMNNFFNIRVSNVLSYPVSSVLSMMMNID